MYHPDCIPPPEVPVINGVRFDDMRRSYLATFTNISVYILVCLTIYILWGWKVALLYAVTPTNVSGVAWKTGNYYMTTSFLVLTAYYFLSHFSWGIVPAIAFYWAALHSTISALPLLAVALLYPHGYLLSIPLTIFLTGSRWRAGIKKRKEDHDKLGITVGDFTWRNFVIAPEVIAYYILMATGFLPKAFFHTFGREGHLGKLNRYALLSFVLVTLFIIWGLTYSPLGLFWFLMFIGVFSQFLKSPGQFVAERYTYISQIGFCIILCSFFERSLIGEQLYWTLFGVWTMITLKYIPAWKNNEALFSHGIVSYPECPDNYVNISSLFMEKNQFVRAIAPLECAIKLGKGTLFKLWGNLAKCCAVMGHYEKAYKALGMAMLEAPESHQEDLKNMQNQMKGQMEKIHKNRKKLKEMGII